MKFLISFLLLLLSFQGKAAERLDSIPVDLLGNWVNAVSQEWEYGFFEQFAICQSEFWDYKTVEQQGKRWHVVLEKGGKEVELNFRSKSGNSLQIALNKGKSQVFERYEGGFLPYHTQDSLLFQEPELVEDSVLILGYYRNLNKVEPAMKGNWGAHEVIVNYIHFLDDKNIELRAPMDSLGRFRLKIPVCAPQWIQVDRRKLWSSILVVPGETVMLCVDITEFIPNEEERNDRSAYMERRKDILFMGEYARLHRELFYCPQFMHARSMSELTKSAQSHMEYLRLAEADYSDFINTFTNFRYQYPTLSGRCIQVVEMAAKYRFGKIVMQNRFNVRSEPKFGFDDPAFMQYVKEHFCVDRALYYCLASDFKRFILDYTGYYDDLAFSYVEGMGMCRTMKEQYPEALRVLVEQGDLEVSDKAEMTAYIALMDRVLQGKYMSSGTPQTLKDSCLLVKYNYLQQAPAVKDMKDILNKRERLLLYDTLISCRLLRELLTAASFIGDFHRDRIPLSGGMTRLLKEKVTSEVLQKMVIAMSNDCRKRIKKEIRYPQSLKNTNHLKELKNADSLWQALVAPYRGKVVYLDIWGSWCGPCKSMMGLVGPLEQAYQDKDVIFMYFAYASPQESWKNVIKEYDLSGKHIVHYNLPPEQQKWIIDLLKVGGYPTFMLIDREGKIVNRNAPSPAEVQKLKAEIEALL